ncbi:hypothetical protein LSH36_366g06006 [Paralvinella palmiformis]|uniref:UDP-N-acetylglucosamine diphosphorylase n=1 Tax=Paralvinella palmiformis TaxID=53620 RepID=A0AAD9JDX5_9ANNE|nr:hypothetical protein LSH36_366g06006 [Paralvinella palmiformis]
MDVEGLRSYLKKYGQEHCLDFWDTLSAKQQETLYKDLKALNLEEITKYFNRCEESLKHPGEKIDDHLQPLPAECFGSIVRTDENKLKLYESEGLHQISESRVAVLLLAGGQGTRLGVNYPKGMYDVSLPSHKTLFQLQAERLIKVQELAHKLTGKEGIVPWYIMTSEHTQEATRQFFQKHDYFGLNPDDVTFFEQFTLPCMTFEGKIILETPYKLARAPDGNGGLYHAMESSGVMDDMTNRGVKYIHVYCVDNILVKMADPHFIGFCIQKGAHCGAKVVEKTSATEPVGVVCKHDGKYRVVEYSEITLKTAEKRNPDGRLTFSAGGICIHFFTTEFLRKIIKHHQHELIHHVAKKKIPYTDSKGETVRPDQPNGIKMEKFIFDVFPFSDSQFAVWEVLREDEFAPLKNSDSAPADNPTTSRHSVFNLHMRFVIKAGGSFVGEDGAPLPHIPSQREEYDEPIVCEISPLMSYSGEGLSDLVRGKTFRSPLVLKASGENGKESMMLEH